MQPLLIGPYSLGVHKDLKPFMIPDEAFPQLENAFVWRGRVERKAGFQNIGRLRRAFASVVLPTPWGAPSVITLKTELGITEPNATIAPGFVLTFAAPISQTLTDNGTGTLAIAPAGAITAATVNYVTGNVTISGAAGAVAVTFTGGYYPGLPAMGIRTREVAGAINFETNIFFDTTYAYRFSGNNFEELPSTLPVTWTGGNMDQFWSENFQYSAGNNLFWVTNNIPGLHSYIATAVAGSAWAAGIASATITAAGHNFSNGERVSLVNAPVFNVVTGSAAGTVRGVVPGVSFIIDVRTPTNPYFQNGAGLNFIASGDPLISQNNANQDGIRIYDGTTWANFNPAISGDMVLVGGLMLIAYKNRMVVLNTWESNNTALAPTHFQQRARWSENGTAWHGGIAWRDDIPGRGGYVDAATNEAIVAAEFVKDNLIVYFERSTWQLVYTQNEVLPFTWLRINAELGAESTFSAVRFDDGVVAYGNVGIHTCNGVSVQRIDTVIPDEIFSVHNGNDGPKRVSGVRDFYQEIVYFAFPGQTDNTPNSVGKTFYPNRMMIYNYRNNTFAFTNDAATCFGYFQRVNDVTWSQLNYFTWSAWNTAWNAGNLQSGFPSIAFGNQQGFINLIIVDSSYAQESLAVTGLTGSTVTSPQHGLFVGDYVMFKNLTGSTNLNLLIFRVLTVTDENTFTIDGTATGTYTGNGVIALVPNISIITKQFTPFWTKGKSYTMRYVDLLFDKTSEGELHLDIFIDFNTSDSMTAGSTRLGTASIATYPEGATLPFYSFQQQQAQIWKRFYIDAVGETFQLTLSYDDTQMRDTNIVFSDVVLHGMILYFDEAGEFY